MATRQSVPRSGAERMRAHRERLRAQGLKPVQVWLPDRRSPEFQALLEREGAIIAASTEEKEVMDWIEAATAGVDWDK